MEYFLGQASKFDIISRSHGRRELTTIENVSVEPQHNQKQLWFFNVPEAFPISIFESVSGSFGYLNTEDKAFRCALMNFPFTLATPINDDPAAYQKLTFLLNCRSNEGNLIQGVLIKCASVAGNGSSMTPREEQHSTVNYRGATRYLVQGCGIQYARFTNAVPDASITTLATDYKMPATTPFTVTYASASPAVLPASLLINIIDPLTTRYHFFVLKNGDPITTGFTATATTFTLAAEPATTDVFELFYAAATVI